MQAGLSTVRDYPGVGAIRRARRRVAVLLAGRKWFDTLSAFGWTGTDERLAQLCAMLLGNEIMAWPQLALVGEPVSWPGADEFLDDELDILRRLKRRGDDVPRLAHDCWCAVS